MMRELQEHLDDIESSEGIKLVVLEANGPVFSSGHDLKEVRQMQLDAAASDSKDEILGLFDQCSKLMCSITELRVPVVAKVKGVATAAGCQLVASCDMAFATTESRFATPGVNIGLFCSTPAVALSRSVGKKAAMEMLLTGDMIDAERAVSLGLINHAVPAEEIDTVVDDLCEKIAGKATTAIGIGKRAFYHQLNKDLHSAYTDMSTVMTDNTVNVDANEGIGAFIEKRHPVWSK